RFDELDKMQMPPAHRLTRQLDPIPSVNAFESMKRQVILPAAHDRVGQHSRASKASLDRKLGSLTNPDIGSFPVSVLAHELRLDDARNDKRRRSSFDHLGDLFADLVERIEAFALDLVGDDLDIDSRKVLRDRLAA